MRIKNPDVTLTVTDDHFNRAVAGDPCHCTIGEATHDALKDFIPALNLKDVDAATIQVHPATIDGEPVVSVGFVATDSRDEEVTVRFLLEQTAAFKVAYVTDNRATAGMRRAARTKPYAFAATEVKIRKRDRRIRPDVAGNPTLTPEKHVAGRATNMAQRSATADEAVARTLESLEGAAKAKELPYKLTAQLKRHAAKRAVASFEARGTKPRTSTPVKVYTKKRFYVG